MPFLGQDCVPHGTIAQTGVCCESLVPWAYDANSGQAYDGFGCWNAQYADVGQWAGPGGINSEKCKPGLVVVAGKCAQPTNQPPVTTGCATIGKAPLQNQTCCTGLQRDAQGLCNAPANIPGGSDEWITGIPNDYIIYGGLGLLALLMLGGKK